MPELKSPAGTVVSVESDLSKRLMAQGWVSTEAPKRGRPKKETTEAE